MIEAQAAVDAIRRRRVVELGYGRDRSPRIVHPHILFLTSTGKQCLDAYQLSGPTHGGPLPGWRDFELRKIATFVATGETFELAPGFNGQGVKYRHGVIASVGR
jgi:hypothetical protein